MSVQSLKKLGVSTRQWARSDDGTVRDDLREVALVSVQASSLHAPSKRPFKQGFPYLTRGAKPYVLKRKP